MSSRVRRGIRVLTLILLILIGVLPGAVPAAVTALPARRTRPLHVVLLTPRNDEFWTLASQITQAAGQDLGVEVEWLPAMNDAKKHLADALAVLARPVKPDAILLKNFDGTARPILEAAEKAGVYTIFFEEGFNDEEARQMGKPREKFHYWLGEFIPDSFEAGYDLGKALIARARQRFPGQKLSMVGIAGNMIEGVSVLRVQGMLVALREHPKILLHEIAAGYYKEEAARIKTLRLLQAYQGTQIIWAINDTMPVGVAKALDQLQTQGLLPVRPILGGCGTTPPAAADVWNRRVDVSVGGHFLLPAFTLLLLYDYFHGADFARESTIMRLQMFTFTRDNIRRYYDAFHRADGKNDWNQVDFRRFSKAINPQLIKYPFGFQAILDQLN
ncbi:MAG: ABC transporter substrate-binding protein [Candidatus Sericytochromatia bacterium]